MRKKMWMLVAFIGLLGITNPTLGEEYPGRNISLIIPVAPGGSAGISGQILAEAMKKHLGQMLVVTYKPGAAQAMGTEQVVKARPDGYTLGYTFEPDLASKIVMDAKTLSFGKNDFTHIGATAFSPQLLYLKSDAPWKTFDELVAYGKVNELSFSTAGVGAMNHILVELIAKKTGIKINHVPYPGGGPANTALLGGHVNMAIGSVGRMKQYIDSGHLRPIVSLSEKRLPEHLDIPTMREKGYDVVGYVYHHLFAAKGLPANVASKLNEAFVKTVNDPEFQDVLTKAGFEPRLLNASAAKEKWESDFKMVEEILVQGGMVK